MRHELASALLCFQALDLVLASGFSKMIAASCTYPHEVVRSQMHISGLCCVQCAVWRYSSEVAFSSGTASFSGCVSAIQTVWAQDGIKSLYRGCLTNLCRTTPAAAITFTSFELVSRFLRDWLTVSAK